MPRVLIFASTLTHIRNFHLPYIRFFKEQGYEVHVAANGGEKPEGADYYYDTGITKSFLSTKNLAAVFRVRKILRDRHFDLLVTHTALAGAVGRLAAALAGKGDTKVIHTAHGYLFWNGCGWKTRLLYRLPERLMRGVTDCVIAMNREDALTARGLVKRGGEAALVPGMGVDPARFVSPSPERRASARRALGIAGDRPVAVYAAEFSKRKNHIELLRGLSIVAKDRPDILLVLCGEGKLRPEIERETVQLGLTENVLFAGWRGNMEEIYAAADLSVTSSISEGLPFNVLESQLCGIPVIASAIRGHTDLIEDGATGWLYPAGDPVRLASVIRDVLLRGDLGRAQAEAAMQTVRKYTLDQAYKANTDIYKKYMGKAGAENGGK